MAQSKDLQAMLDALLEDNASLQHENRQLRAGGQTPAHQSSTHKEGHTMTDEEQNTEAATAKGENPAWYDAYRVPGGVGTLCRCKSCNVVNGYKEDVDKRGKCKKCGTSSGPAKTHADTMTTYKVEITITGLPEDDDAYEQAIEGINNALRTTGYKFEIGVGEPE